MTQIVPATIQFTELSDPSQLTTGLALLIVVPLILLFWGAVRIRSAVTLGVWVFSLLSLVFVLLGTLPFQTYLAVLSLNGLMMGISMTVAVYYAE